MRLEALSPTTINAVLVLPEGADGTIEAFAADERLRVRAGRRAGSPEGSPVVQVLVRARQVHSDVGAGFPQVPRRADAGQPQRLRRAGDPVADHPVGRETGGDGQRRASE